MCLLVQMETKWFEMSQCLSTVRYASHYVNNTVIILKNGERAVNILCIINGYYNFISMFQDMRMHVTIAASKHSLFISEYGSSFVSYPLIIWLFGTYRVKCEKKLQEQESFILYNI